MIPAMCRGPVSWVTSRSAFIEQRKRLRKSERADQVRAVTAMMPGKERLNPLVVRTSDEHNFKVSFAKQAGKRNVIFRLPAAQCIVAQQVFGAGRSDHDSRFAGAWQRAWREAGGGN